MFISDEEAEALYRVCKAMVSAYSYNAAECARTRPNGPCKSCRAVLEMEELIADIENGEE